MHMVSRKDLHSPELETVRGLGKSDDGGNSQRRSADKKKKRPCMSKNWIYS